MNEFTKQELEDIRDCIDYAYRSNPISPRISLTLRNKIQSMIENYCAHDSNGGECEIFLDTCSKCNAFMLRETHYE